MHLNVQRLVLVAAFVAVLAWAVTLTVLYANLNNKSDDSGFLYSFASTNRSFLRLDEEEQGGSFVMCTAKQVIELSDRPNRLARAVPTSDFVDQFSTLFASSKPNSFVYGHQQGKLLLQAAVVLSSVMWEGDCLRLMFEDLELEGFTGQPGLQDFTEAYVYIDSARQLKESSPSELEGAVPSSPSLASQAVQAMARAAGSALGKSVGSDLLSIALSYAPPGLRDPGQAQGQRDEHFYFHEILQELDKFEKTLSAMEGLLSNVQAREVELDQQLQDLKLEDKYLSFNNHRATITAAYQVYVNALEGLEGCSRILTNITRQECVQDNGAIIYSYGALDYVLKRIYPSIEALTGLLLGTALTPSMFDTVAQVAFRESIDAWVNSAKKQGMLTSGVGITTLDIEKSAYTCIGKSPLQKPLVSQNPKSYAPWDLYVASDDWPAFKRECNPSWESNRPIISVGVPVALTEAAATVGGFFRQILSLYFQAGYLLVPAVNRTSEEPLLKAGLIDPLANITDMATKAWQKYSSEDFLKGSIEDALQLYALKVSDQKLTDSQYIVHQQSPFTPPFKDNDNKIDRGQFLQQVGQYMAWDVHFVAPSGSRWIDGTSFPSTPNCITIMKEKVSLDISDGKLYTLEWRPACDVKFDEGKEILGVCASSCEKACGSDWFACSSTKKCKLAGVIDAGNLYNCCGPPFNLFTATQISGINWTEGVPIPWSEVYKSASDSLDISSILASVQEPQALSSIYRDSNSTVMPTFAFTYTSQEEDFFEIVTGAGFHAVYVYAGDVEFYCRGQPTSPSGGGNSSLSEPCIFSGPCSNAFVYYEDFSRSTASKFANKGVKVLLNFDGRILPKDEAFVPDFSLLSEKELEEFAVAVGSHVCNDPNVEGMGWDVEPFDNNQIYFFRKLDEVISSCQKEFGVFTFAENMNETMWTEGLGNSGFLLDSTYDLPCDPNDLPPYGCQACQCTPPAVYKSILSKHMENLVNMSTKYQKPFQLVLSGSATTQMYEKVTTSTCKYENARGHEIINRDCNTTMHDWIEAAIEVFQDFNVPSNPLFRGFVVYEWTAKASDGLEPSVVQEDVLNSLKQAGFLPGTK